MDSNIKQENDTLKNNTEKPLKSVKSFLNYSKKLCMLAEYDFKNEKDYDGQSNIEKMLNYKDAKERFDCDGSGYGNTERICMLARDVYRTLWNWNDRLDNLNQYRVSRYGSSCFDNGASMGPETMNSFLTTYDNRGNVKKEIFENFAQMTHCLGNFILTYEGYNKYVGKDYWDLKLNNQYKNKSTFIEYINTFFLWDYTYIDEDNNSYGIKSLYKSEFKQNDGNNDYLINGKLRKRVILPTDEEIITFLDNVNWAIKRRGIFMAAMLIIAEKYPESYLRIQLTVFGKSKVYSGYTEVLEEIDNIKNLKGNSIIKTAKERISEFK